MPDTITAITARLLEIGDSLAFAVAMRGDTPESLEWADLRRQLFNLEV